MNYIHLLFIFHKRNVKFCFVKKKYKKNTCGINNIS